jgi:glycerol-3-phosphate dehydrogenase
MSEQFDVVVIGGGATGLGVAVEAATRGYKTVLFEAYDFGTGTSSKSTKLVHGGIRYLANFDFALVHEGLSERFHFLKNAPHIAHAQGYLVPFYSIWDKFKYFLGINLYDLLAGNKKVGKSKFLNSNETLQFAPDLNTTGLCGGAIYYDGQFDDTRMLVTLLRTFQKYGGVAYNYHQITSFIKDADFKVIGVNVLDKLNNKQLSINAKVVVNATGTLTDTILDLDEPAAKHNHVTAAQGTHLVFDKDIFASNYALVIPKTSDERILFVLPWHDKVVVGTTDIAVAQAEIDPIASQDEIEFILDTLNQYTIKTVSRADIRSVFTGQRPLVRPANAANTAKISRKHEILYSQSGILSIVGGKWTIYRLMGEDTIDFAINQHLLSPKKSKTRHLHLFGYVNNQIDLIQLDIKPFDIPDREQTENMEQNQKVQATTPKNKYPLNVYGTDADKILQIQKDTGNFDKLHPNLPYYAAEVIYQIRYEMAKTIEDILARRTRAVLLNAMAAKECATTVGKLMASELGRDENWVSNQLHEFDQIVDRYIVKTYS